MEADWVIEAGEDDPWILLPWLDPDGRVTYVDLQLDPLGIDLLPEVNRWPELRLPLLQLNSCGPQLTSTKCDAWELSLEERQHDLGEFQHGVGTYVDIMFDREQWFRELPLIKILAERLASAAAKEFLPNARTEFVVRPALWSGAPGFGITIYIFGHGESALLARQCWATYLYLITALKISTAIQCGLRASSSIG